MGIRNLNTYLRSICSKESIRKQHLKMYENKKIVIDISIYLYKFVSEEALLENVYLMISIFKKYNIIPLFVFDGKPPLQKSATIKQRRLERRQAYEMYNELINKNIDNKEMRAELDILKRKMAYLREEDIKNVQLLIKSYGVNYYISSGEADSVCSYLVSSGKADMCLSDDTDMFMYNCPKVLRNLSLINHTVIECNTAEILNELSMTVDEFQKVMVLNGTDYNITNNVKINEIVNLFYKYKNEKIVNDSFYDWLSSQKQYNIDIHELEEINNIFKLDIDEYNNITKNIIIENGTLDTNMLYTVLQKEGFIYNNVDNRLPW